jgi:hypothetical protein
MTGFDLPGIVVIAIPIVALLVGLRLWGRDEQ